MNQNRQKKSQTITDLKTKLQNSKAVVLTDYTGLKVSQIIDLRSRLKTAGGDYLVAKNTLLSLALDVKPDSPLAPSLNGPTAVVFAITDESSPLKVLTQFIKANSIPAIKSGLLGDKVLSPQEVNELSTLPSRDVLLAKFMGLLKAPATNLVSVLTGNHRKLVYLLAKISESKSN